MKYFGFVLFSLLWLGGISTTAHAQVFVDFQCIPGSCEEQLPPTENGTATVVLGSDCDNGVSINASISSFVANCSVLFPPRRTFRDFPRLHWTTLVVRLRLISPDSTQPCLPSPEECYGMPQKM